MKIHQREIRTQVKRTKDRAKTLQNPEQVVAPLVIRKSEQKSVQLNPETGSLSEESWSMKSTKNLGANLGALHGGEDLSEEDENGEREGGSRHRKHRTRETSDLGENQNSGRGAAHTVSNTRKTTPLRASPNTTKNSDLSKTQNRMQSRFFH
jgi:hypothetical protein